MVGEISLLEKYISLTFDEDPKIRKMAAEKLAKIDDPAATFALLELCYDKDVGVREIARKALNMKEPQINQSFSLSEIFSSDVRNEESETLAKNDDGSLKIEEVKRLLDKKLGAKDKIKEKMLPKIRKIFSQAAKSKVDSAIQEMLPQYLDVVSKIDNINKDGGVVSEHGEEDVDMQGTDALEEVGSAIDEGKIAKEIQEVQSVEEEEQKFFLPKSDDIYSKIASIYLLSDGDEKILNQEIKKMKKLFENEIKTAVKLARRTYKTQKITKLSELKDKMRNITTSVLLVKDVRHGTYQKSKRKVEQYTRILVEDDGGVEGVIYLFGDRGKVIIPGMRIKVEKGVAKTFKFSSETAIVIPKKGNLYIVV